MNTHGINFDIGFAIDKERFTKGSRFDTRFFDELLEEIREIRASERMVYQKITDIYATSVDYSIDTLETEKFFATVQNKLHFAITGNTAAEIISSRAVAKELAIEEYEKFRIKQDTKYLSDFDMTIKRIKKK